MRQRLRADREAVLERLEAQEEASWWQGRDPVLESDGIIRRISTLVRSV